MSVPGNISSTKLTTAPCMPALPPKAKKNVSAEIGAQKISPISPKPGMI